MVDGRAGGDPMSPTSEQQAATSRRNAVLYGVALVLGCAAVVLSVLAWNAWSADRAAAADHERYGDVLAAARDEAHAFVNIDHRKAEESVSAVREGATGKFAEQYARSSKPMIDLLKDNRSVMRGEIVWAGVVDADPDSAKVLVATTGTVQNVTTKDRPMARDFRLQLTLQREGDRWLTSDLQFVG